MSDHERGTCTHCDRDIHRVYPFGWLHDGTGRRRCELAVYVDAEPRMLRFPGCPPIRAVGPVITAVDAL